MWDKRAEYLGNTDGDTVKMILDQGFGDTKLVTIRLLGVYAPELSEKGGPECQKFVEDWFDSHTSSSRWSFVVTTSRMKRTDREQMTLDRYVGVITDAGLTNNLNAEITEFIHTNGYGGGTGAV